MKYLSALKLSLPFIAGFSGEATTQDAEALDTIRNNIEAMRGSIVACEVNEEGVEQITLRNGDVIANPNWFHDSFSLAVEDPQGEFAIYDPKKDVEIPVTDLCVRTDGEIPSHANEDMNIDFGDYQYMCVSSGILVQPFQVSNGEILIINESIASTFFHSVSGDEIVMGRCEFELDGEQIVAPIIPQDVYERMP